MTEQQWTVSCQTSLSSIVSWYSLRFMSTELVMLSNHLILCCPLLLLPSIFPSIRIFSSELAHHIRWPKYWSFSNSSSKECSGFISCRIDWLDLLVVQGTLKSLLQHHSSKALDLVFHLDLTPVTCILQGFPLQFLTVHVRLGEMSLPVYYIRRYLSAFPK